MENENNKTEPQLVSALKPITGKSCLLILSILVTAYVWLFSGAFTISRDVVKGPDLRVQETTDGCYLEDKLQAPHLPDLHSVFADRISGQVVFVGLKLLRQTWHRVLFRCEFPSGDISVVHAVDDRRSFGHLPQYVVVLTCPIPNEYRLRSSFNITLRRLPGTDAYRNIKACATSNEKHFLAMCTMVKSVDAFIPQWLDYHRYLGVQHVYIYDNDKPAQSTLQTSLQNYIKAGFVTLIPWAHSTSVNKTYLEVQIAHENDCIWRHKHDVDWMIKIDVDEYIQPMDARRPRIPEYLNDSLYDSVAAVRIQNWFFGHPPRIAPRGDSVIERNRWRAEKHTLQNTGHDKNILRPINVHYYKIHSVKLGGDVISADPYTEMRLVHYRTDNQRARHFDLPKFKERDESMVRIRQALVNHRLQGRSSKNNKRRISKKVRKPKISKETIRI
ncbi:uncharacterized protein LOC119735236 [Patiria miniata]|uniref:Glycosyltransferase family 92 protein n=1 Tax=Patiria miniata TaxID=46514 RepID=A0A914ALJ0_PATMI|nr:uncharacterized protein LOC119735236 [Patiria miniata]